MKIKNRVSINIFLIVLASLWLSIPANATEITEQSKVPQPSGVSLEQAEKSLGHVTNATEVAQFIDDFNNPQKTKNDVVTVSFDDGGQIQISYQKNDKGVIDAVALNFLQNSSSASQFQYQISSTDAKNQETGQKRGHTLSVIARQKVEPQDFDEIVKALKGKLAKKTVQKNDDTEPAFLVRQYFEKFNNTLDASHSAVSNENDPESLKSDLKQEISEFKTKLYNLLAIQGKHSVVRQEGDSVEIVILLPQD